MNKREVLVYSCSWLRGDFCVKPEKVVLCSFLVGSAEPTLCKKSDTVTELLV